MRYRDVTSGDRPLPPSHPHLATLTIDPVHWHDLEQFDDDSPAIRILGHDAPQDGLMRVYVACASRSVRNRLEDGWG